MRAPNRLQNETSPYLRQHAHNPVDWYPWGEEAFEKARREDLPIFLSIGYSSCHWCHVMERESFEDEGIAAILNERYVSIKVDREERPDVDDVYMTAVQMTTGHGGWPLSAFLLPDRRPFFTGTYFPPYDRGGRAGFRTILLRLSEAYQESRPDVEETAGRLAEALAGGTDVAARRPGQPLSRETLVDLTRALLRSFDTAHGGFGSAPKFPPHLALDWLLTRGAAGDGAALDAATRTLEAMALGGIHDHLAGGFHRYSTDERWLLPHFEKMLTDNAQLLGVYARAYAVTGRGLFRLVAEGIGDYLLREMRTPEGGFFAATDADSEGEEGRFFVWSAAEIAEVLGADDAAFLGRHYSVLPEGNFHDESTGRPTGLNILHLGVEPSPEDEARLAPLRRKLYEHRQRRVPPALDDKRISGWIALAVSGLAAASRALSEPRYLAAARDAARFVDGTMRDGEGRLLRSWKDGIGKVPAFLEDETYLANAFLDLADADSGEGRAWALGRAAALVSSLRARFRRPDGPGFRFTGEGHETLLMQGRDLFDKAIPSGSGWATRALARLSAENPVLAREAREALDEVAGLMARAPHGTESWYLALEALLDAGEAVPHGAHPPHQDAGPDRSVPVTLRVEPPSEPARRGGTLELQVGIRIAAGYYLPAVPLEVWGGSDLACRALELPPPSDLVKDGETTRGHEGTFEARAVLDVAAGAATGPRDVVVQVRFTACGDGACLPQAIVSMAVPVRVA